MSCRRSWVIVRQDARILRSDPAFTLIFLVMPIIVMAFVVAAAGVPRSDETKRVLQTYFKQSGPPYMYPREIAFVDSLPRTLNGKILRSELRQTAETLIG